MGPQPEKTNYNKVFFDHNSPSLKGKVKVVDRIILDPRCGIYNWVQGNGMQPFDQLDRDGPDETARTVMA